MLFKQYFLRGFLFKEFRCSLRSECDVRLFRQGWSATCAGMAGRDAQVSAITNKTVTKEQRDLATFWAWSVWVTCLVLKSKCILTVTKLSYIAFTTIMTSTTLISTQISLSCFCFVFVCLFFMASSSIWATGKSYKGAGVSPPSVWSPSFPPSRYTRRKASSLSAEAP